ncbi:MAG: SulP family inorganic anion transporter [Spirochaetes bacterium]|nr:SulP family inorganic anion transporter [Spirochaetota bacterium]
MGNNGADAAGKDPLGSLLGDCTGGITAAILAIPGNMVCGLIAFAPLGPEYAKYGIISAMLVSVFTGITAGALGSIRSLITGPQVSTAIIFASVIERLLRTGPFPAGDGRAMTVLLAMAFGAVLLSGVMQALLSVFRAGKLIRYIPYPVIAAIFDSTAILIIGGQLTSIVKVARTVAWIGTPATEILARLGQFDAFQVEITLFTFVVCLVVGFLARKLPAPLIALLAGCAAFYGLEYAFFHDRFDAAFAGVRPTAMTFSFDIVRSYPAFLAAKYRPLYGMIAYSALSIAVIGSLDTLFAGMSLSATLQKKHRGNQDLFGQGIGNVVGSLMGAIPGEGFLTRTMVNHEAGGSTFISVAVYGGVVFAIVFFLNGYLTLIPKPVISGIMLHTGLRIVDAWSLRLPIKLVTARMRDKKEIFLNILVIGSVIAVSLAFDLITAVFVGLALSIATFFGQMNEDIIRRIYTGRIVHSKKARNRRCTALLEKYGGCIAAMELEGALFFGSAVAVAEHLDRVVDGRFRFIILDFRRVTRVDVSGVKMLQTIAKKLGAMDIGLLLGSVSGTSGLQLYVNDFKFLGGTGKVKAFPDADYALEYAEDQVLKEHGEDPANSGSMELEGCLVSYGFDTAQAARLLGYFEGRELKKGSFVFRERSKGTSLYVLTAGLAEAVIAIPEQRRHRRIGTYSPGTMFGETALLDGGERTMTVRLMEKSVVHRLSKVKFNLMRKKDPSLAFHLLAIINGISAEKLREAYEVIAEFEKG